MYGPGSLQAANGVNAGVTQSTTDEKMQGAARNEPASPVERIEAKRRVLSDDWATDTLGSQPALLLGDLVGLALELWKVDLLVRQDERQRVCVTITGLCQVNLDLLEFFSIAGDEGDRGLAAACHGQASRQQRQREAEDDGATRDDQGTSRVSLSRVSPLRNSENSYMV